MKPITLSLLTTVLLLPFLSEAQITTTYHQTFKLEGATSKVIVDISYPFKIKKWMGNTILVETSIEITKASRQLLDHFIQRGRYEVVRKDFGSTAKLEMKPMLRKDITTQQGICEEEVLFTFYIPTQFEVSTAGRIATVSN